MKTTKITENPSKEQVKDTTNIWKNKAVSLRAKNNALRKRITELTTSRDNLKTKYKALQQRAGRQRNSAQGEIVGGVKASGHQYSLALVCLMLEMHKYGAMSLRSCRNSLGCMLVALGLSARLPSHSTIRNWLCKGGFHRLETTAAASGEYVAYVDESIVFGSEKILLILGVPVAKIPTTRALTHSDMEVLYVGANTEWKAEHIAAELEKIAENKPIIYAVSDEGHNLRKAYKSLNYTHIEDCTHVLANYLKRLYEKDADFEAFRKLIGHLRKQWNLSKENSRYMPPTMRGKMRFANIFPCTRWVQSRLAEWSDLSESVQERLAFLKEKEAFFAGLAQVSAVFKTVCATLKNEGFGATQHADILAQLATISARTADDTDGKVATFIENCTTYLAKLSTKSTLLARPHLLVSSDIIESFFGKFKTKINANNRSGLTEFLFTIANFSQSFSVEETKKALESVQLKDLKLVKTREKPA